MDGSEIDIPENVPVSPLKSRISSNVESTLYKQDYINVKTSIAIIVPIRDRKKEENFIRLYFTRFLSQFQNISYEIFFAEQSDDYLFNKGLLVNAAFLSLKNRSFDCFCLQDADTIPMTNKLLYRCPKGLAPYHVTPGNLHPHVHYDGGLYGIVIFTSEQFEHVNGFGTHFWGWGKEDDNLAKRFKESNMWPFEVPTETSERFLHLDCAPQRIENKASEDVRHFLFEDLGFMDLLLQDLIWFLLKN
eukprot:jgi/Galph1/2927/GphlegSOOS_G1566.1